MAAIKYSRQREAIKHYLASTKEHPTADTVYLHVKEDFPNISLGTVYRNLNLLTDIGEAIKIPTPDGGDRFDGNVIPHNHFLCTSCGPAGRGEFRWNHHFKFHFVLWGMQ